MLNARLSHECKSDHLCYLGRVPYGIRRYSTMYVRHGTITHAGMLISRNGTTTGRFMILAYDIMQSVRCSDACIVTVDSTLLEERRFTRDYCFYSTILFRRTGYSNWRLALRKPLDQSCLSLFSLFLGLYCILCAVLTIVYFCPLLIFWSWWILMVRHCMLSTLSRRLPWSATKTRGSDSIQCTHPARTPTSWQPSCLPVWEAFGSPQTKSTVPVQEHDHSRDQARNYYL